jgi:glycosyltransferase involved in cell wall biosynthesis
MKTACMVAYANYFTDARIKNYVHSLIKRGYKVDVFALGKSDGSGQSGVRMFSIMEKYWGDSAIAYALSQVCFLVLAALYVGMNFLTRRYSFVHVHNIPNFLVFTAIVPKLFGAKVILDIHDTMPECYATKFDCSLDHPVISLLRCEERLSAAFADFIITTNEWHKKVLCSHGLDADKIGIIMNVGNESIFHPVSRKRRGEELTIVYHGTIAERLGIDLIVKAVVMASATCPRIKLLLIGEGDYLEEVGRLVSEMNAYDRVRMMGFVPVERLPEHLSQADVGIIGNRLYTEAKQNYMLPVKMLEYSAMEIPTVAPSLRAIRHYFDDGAAIFYEPDDLKDMAQRLIDIYMDREIISRVKEKLNHFNKIYNWKNMEDEYITILSGIIDKGQR